LLDHDTGLELSWNGSGAFDVYLVLSNELPNNGRPLTWRVLEISDQGNITYRPQSAEEISALIYPRESGLILNSIRVDRVDFIAVEFSTTSMTTLSTITSYISTYPVYETVTATTSRIEPTKIPYTTQITTVFTETRYSELSFTAFMGSFLIFVGIVLMVLLIRVIPKLQQETKK
jgi:hypothetical protein